MGGASTFENIGDCGITIGTGAGGPTIRDSYFEGNANSGVCATGRVGGSPANGTISNNYFIGHNRSHIYLTNAIGWQIYGNFAQVETPAKTFITLLPGAVLTFVGYNRNTNTTFLVDGGVATLTVVNDTRAAYSKKILDHTVEGEKRLCLASRLEVAHVPFPLAGRLMQGFGAIVGVTFRVVVHTG